MAEERDFILARLAVASAHAHTASDAIDDCINLFVFPFEDKNGSDRTEALDIISSASGELSRAIEAAQSIMESMNKEQLAEEEPSTDESEESGEETD